MFLNAFFILLQYYVFLIFRFIMKYLKIYVFKT